VVQKNDNDRAAGCRALAVALDFKGGSMQSKLASLNRHHEERQSTSLIDETRLKLSP